MKIGVSGVSGKLGQKTLQFLLNKNAGHTLVGISRTPDGLPDNVEARAGDYNDRSGLVNTYQSLDRLLLIPGSDLTPGVRGAQMKAAIDAACQAGVGHIFMLSAAGTREDTSAIGEAYWSAEQALIRTAPRWTILRMNYYAESMAEEIQMSLNQDSLAGLGQEKVAYVSREDVAAAAAAALLSEGHGGAIYNLTGPEIISGEQRARLVSELLGKTIQYASVTAGQLQAGLSQSGLPDFIINAIIEIKTNFVKGYFDVLTGDTERLSGRPAKSLRDVLQSTLIQK
ncbi:SDR family oxidoreductase [Erwinia sp. MMLR14_017]|uniref:SDR family oxidoreductase n=1 Tax=Erwinia sp. MMLR14_017 TaxID=3093842 RepID=UPI00298F5E8B|nr:SDR family oxidoreductase [Erwinia sp. MMLR14_017]MDW8845042.1 SDR family oxidoreductase [Erwinia sp. MMLR14_017]